MKIHRPSLHPSGLTLLELLVVLTILVVLSTVAITSTSGVADQARYEATQRTLENIRDAVIGPANLRDSDGSLLITGFLADMGRLPHATAEAVTGGNVFTLRELWENVNGVAAHAVRQASSANVDLATEADDEVYLATGWRGPYLQLPPGNMTLRDGWAAEFVTPDGVVNGYPNALLRNPTGVDITAAGQSIGQVNSFGANAIENVANVGYDRDLNVVFSTAQITAQAAVTVQIVKSDGTPATPPANGDHADIIVRVFGPNSNNGLIKVDVDAEEFEENNSTPPFTISTRLISFNDLTPGPHVVRAYYDGNRDGYHTSDPLDRASSAMNVIIRPGGNFFTIILRSPVP